MEMSCGILISNDNVDAYPRGIFSYLQATRFNQGPSVAIRRTACFHQGVIVVVFLRRESLAIRFNANGRICGQLFILFSGLLGQYLIQDLSDRGRLKEYVCVLNVLRFELNVGILCVCSGGITRRLRSNVGVFKEDERSPRQAFQLQGSKRVYVRRVMRDSANEALPRELLGRGRSFVDASTKD